MRVDTFTYDAWETVIERTGTAETQFQWGGDKGYYLDVEMGAYYIRARPYNPTIARWHSIDPKYFLQGTNLYLAFLNTPTSFGDANGNLAGPISTTKNGGKPITLGGWTFELKGGPELLNDLLVSFRFATLATFPKNKVPTTPPALQVWQLNKVTRSYIATSDAKGAACVVRLGADSLVTDKIDATNISTLEIEAGIKKRDPASVSAADFQGYIVKEGLPTPCILTYSVEVSIGFDDGSGTTFPDKTSNQAPTASQIALMRKMRDSSSYSYTYTYLNWANPYCCINKCPGYGVYKNEYSESINTPFVSATSKDGSAVTSNF